eukprot:1104926_1
MSSEDDNQWVADVNKALKDITDAHARATQAYKEYSRLKSNLAELNQAYAKRITDIGHTFSKKIKELKHRCFPLVQWFKDNEVGLTYRRAKLYADLVDFEDVPLLHQLFDGEWHELPCRNMRRLIPLIEFIGTRHELHLMLSGGEHMIRTLQQQILKILIPTQ